MTDDEIKAIVLKYIEDCFESDNADGLHEMDEWYASIDDDPQELLKKGYALFRKATVTVTFDA
jgi:hypothetical protein